MEVLGERPVWSMSDSEKLSALDAVFAETARLKVIGLQLIADMDRSGYATEIGAGSTARLLSKRYRIDSAEAHRDVRLATRLTKYAATTAALPDPAVPFANPATAHPAPGNDATGDKAADEPETSDAANTEDGGDAAGRAWRVSPAQAAAIVSVLDNVPASVSVENLEFAEQRLIGLAATHTPSELRKAGQKIRDILDPDGPEPDEKAAYARESLTWKTAERGVIFRGYLANENAELFRTQIHAHARPHKTIDGDLDPRPLSKRQADALTAILNTNTDTVTGPTADGVTDAVAGAGADAEHGEGGTLIQLPLPPTETRGDAHGEEAHGDDAGGRAARRGDPAHSTGDREFVPGHGPKPHISVTIDYTDLTASTTNATGALVFGDHLSAATVRRLACDAEVLPIVLGSKSQPLDVGTSQRLVTRPMRRALNARDKGCVVCGAPPIHCEAHHVVSWLDHGITATSNLVLLCKRHHLDLHSGHWHIRILDGVVHVTHPTWADPDKIPPGRYHPPTADIVHKPATPPPDPWGDHEHPSDTGQAPSPARPGPPEPAPFDPWSDGDAADTATQRPPTLANQVKPTAFDPWGDAEPDGQDAEPCPTAPGPTGDRSGDMQPPRPACIDPWSDDSPPGPDPVDQPRSARRPAEPAHVDPWADDPPSFRSPA